MGPFPGGIPWATEIEKIEEGVYKYYYAVDTPLGSGYINRTETPFELEIA